MSEDLIKRSDAIRALNREKSDWNCDYNVPIDNCIKRLNKVKSADRPSGEWIWSPRDTDGTVSGCCSNCSFSHLFIGGHTAQYNFCPNCGADMREREGE